MSFIASHTPKVIYFSFLACHRLMIRGNTSDFIDHPICKDSVSEHGPPTTPGPQAPTILIWRWEILEQKELFQLTDIPQ